MKNIILKALCIIGCFMLSGCEPQKNEKVLRIGTSADNPPYEFMQNGAVVGFDIDVANELARRLGKTAEIKNMEFHTLIGELGGGGVDLVVAGMSVTKERMDRTDFTVPYASASVALISRAEDNITDPKDLAGKKVGAQLGSIWSIIAHDLATKYRSNVISLGSNLMLMEELKSKRIDAIVLEEAQVERFMEMNKGLAFMPLKEYSSTFAIAIPKATLHKNEVNNAINSMRSDGTIDNLAKKWGLSGGSQ